MCLNVVLYQTLKSFNNVVLLTHSSRTTATSPLPTRTCPATMPPPLDFRTLLVRLPGLQVGTPQFHTSPPMDR